MGACSGISVYSIGRGDIMYVRDSTAAEFAQFLQPTDEPVATDSFAHISASMNFAQAREATEEKNDTRSTLSTITLRKEGDFDVETYLSPRAQNVKPDIDRILATLFSEAIGHASGSSFAATISSVAANADGLSTDVVVGVTEAANFTVDQGVGIVYPDGQIVVHIVTAVNTGTETVTVRPKIPFAKHGSMVGQLMHAGFTYRPQKDINNCLVMELLRQNEAYVFSGVVPGKVTISGKGTEALRAAFSGFAADLPVYMGTTTQHIDHDAIVTDLQIAKGDADKFTVGSLITWYDVSGNKFLDSGTPNFTIEKMRVTAIDTTNQAYDQITVARAQSGTTALDPDVADLIVPYHPGTDNQGTIISGATNLFAGITFDQKGLSPIGAEGDDFIYRVKNFDVEYDNTIVPINEEYGTDHGTGFNAGKNNSTLKLEAFMHRDFFREYGRARNFKSVGVRIQSGSVLGKTVALWMPKVDFDAQSVEDAANDDIVPTTFNGRLLGTTGQDELFVLFV